MKISSHIMKDILVTNKVGISDVLFSINLNVLAFSGLGELSNSSLATENPSFRQLTVLIQDHVNHRNPVDHIFYKILERELSVA